MAGLWEIEREGIKGSLGEIVSAIIPCGAPRGRSLGAAWQEITAVFPLRGKGGLLLSEGEHPDRKKKEARRRDMT
jgi:hypothetical protein